jgi:type VI secretion system secreted protein VgrG
MFPAKLPDEKTHSALKSLSSPTRDGTNEIRFDDLGGSERVITHAERDQNVIVANDKRENVLADERVQIDRDHAVSIGNDHRATVGANHTSTVVGDATWIVTSDRRRKVSGNENSTVVGNRSLRVGGMHFRRISTDDAVQAKQINEKVGGVILEAFLKTNSTEAKKAMTLVVGGALVEVAKDNKDESAGLGRLETVGGVVFSKAGATMKAGITKSRTTNVGVMLKIDAKEKLLIEGIQKVKGSAGAASFTGKTSVTLRVGESEVLLTDGLLKIVATGTVSMKATAKNEEGASESDQN